MSSLTSILKSSSLVSTSLIAVLTVVFSSPDSKYNADDILLSLIINLIFKLLYILVISLFILLILFSLVSNLVFILFISSV
jgi:hypothetical protein